MIIECPYCKSNYKIEETLISKNGRKVKCFSCANFWIQFPGRKFIKLKSEDSFSTELAKRQNLIRNSLSKKNINIKNMEHGNNLLSKEQEKELLSSLAIAEIELNQINKDNLNSKEEKNSIRKIKVINKSYLGFITVSFIFIICKLWNNSNSVFSRISDNWCYRSNNKTSEISYNSILFCITNYITDFWFNCNKHCSKLWWI